MRYYLQLSVKINKSIKRSKSYMFTKPLNYIVLSSALKEVYEEINKNSSGLDGVDFIEFKKNLSKNLEELSQSIIKGEYSPEPLLCL
jgi:retron-type reverse transcriptase